MRAPHLTYRVDLAWWFWPYLYALVFFCVLMRTEPDQKKLEAVITRAIRLRISR